MSSSRFLAAAAALSAVMWLVGPIGSARAELVTNLIVNGDFEDTSNNWGSVSGENPPDWPPHYSTYGPSHKKCPIGVDA